MSELFLKILNLSITASYVIAAVMLLRLIFRKKAPKKLICALWALVGLRLVCPFSLESVLSLIPSAETVPPEIVSSPAPQIASGFAAFNSVVNPVLSQSFAPTPEQSVSPMQILTGVGAWVWAAGVLAVCLYGLISYGKLKRKMADAVLLSGNIFESEKAESPFILGFFRPKIYLPFSLSDADRENVVAHETAHIRRKDYIIKPLAFLLLAVYWFNPLVWVSYVLLCRDIELACDEKVIRDLSEDSRKIYAKSLLDCAVKRKSIAACPLAFGEVGVKTRIKGVMNYKKPAFWVILLTVAAIIVTSVCFLTNPKKDGDKVGSNDFDSVTVYESKTDYDGKVTLTLIEASVRTESPYFTVRLKNGTDKELVFGEQFYLTKDDSEKSLAQGDRIFHTIGYAVKPGAACDHTYTLEGFDLSEKGSYTFSVPFTVDGGKKEYKVTLGFGLADDFAGKKVGSNDFDSVTVYESKTDYDGKVTLTLTQASVRTQSPYFIVKLQNGTDKDISYGDDFVIVKDDPYRSVSSDVLVDMVYHALSYTVKPGGEKELTYYLDGYDLTEKGSYTFCIPFTVDGEKYKASFSFYLDDDMQVINLTVSGYAIGDKKKSVQSDSALIAPHTTCKLAGTVFDITKVEGDTVTIKLRRPLTNTDGKEVSEFTLKKGGDSVQFTTSVGNGRVVTTDYRFVITDMPSDAQNTTYIASQAIWENGYFSSLAPTGMQYWITDDGELLTNVDESIEPYESRWASLGTLTKSDLTLEQFKSCISSCEWSYSVTPEQLFEKNEKILCLKSDTATYTDYYLLVQKNGDVYLATAFDEKSFRAVYKLSAVHSAASATQNVFAGTEYVLADAESGKTVPTLTLNRKDSSFSFTFDPLSSYLSYGTYERADGKIVCTTDDGQYKYVFKVTDEATLVFDKKASSPVKVTDSKIANEIKDGAVFSAKTDTRKPFTDLDENDIEKITVSTIRNEKDADLSAGQIKKAVTLLHDLEIYQFDNSYTAYYGQTVSIFVAKKDGTAVQLDVLPPFAVVDSVGYLADEVTLEKLCSLVNQILK